METAHALLIVDDDETVRALISDIFATAAYRLFEADSAARARELIDQQPPDLILLDIGLPGEDGLSLARHVRASLDIPIIMVSGADQAIDRIVGLELGADDYVTKPFEPRELLARVRSVLRRYQRPAAGGQPSEHAESRRIGPLRLDLVGHRLLNADGEELPLTRMEFELLNVLSERPGRVLSRDQLLNLTQNRDWDPFDRSIDIRVARLRRKLNAGGGSQDWIRTVRGVGYMFVAPSA
jgi:DNA-binding response OmpR family regulator